MKKIFSFILITVLLNLNVCLPAISINNEINVKEGTRVPITVKSECTSKNIQSGQKINAIIDEDVVINGTVIFKQGDNATIKVSDVKKAGFVGIPGEMYLVNGDVTDVQGGKHSIEYNQKITGEEKTWPKVCLGCGIFIILAPLALFGFVKGGQAKINPSTIIDVSLRNDFKFVPAL